MTVLSSTSMMLSRLVLRQSKRRLLPATSAISFQSARALSPRAHQQHLSPAWECRRLISSTQIQYAEGKGKGKGKKKTKKEKTKAQKEGENDEDEVFMPDIKFREIDASGKKPMLQANIPEQEESRLPLSEPEEKEKIQQQPVAAKAEERSVKKIAPETPITTKPAELASSSVENEGVMKVKEPTVEKRIEKPKPVEDWSSSEALQAIPLHGFYRYMLDSTPEYANPDPLSLKNTPPPPKPAEGKAAPPPPPPPKPAASTPTPQEAPKLAAFPTISTSKPRSAITFSSRLSSPAERSKNAALNQPKSRAIAGVTVPPKPIEPDNCCMSGCVNCVWDLFREDLELYSTQMKLAKEALAREKMVAKPREPILKQVTTIGSSTSIEEDGGGSWIGDQKDVEKEWLEAEEIPVGIRAFMMTEKRLKEEKLKKKQLEEIAMVGTTEGGVPTRERGEVVGLR